MGIKTIFYGILAVISVISKFVWRAGVDTYESASGYGATAWKWKWTALICVGMFGSGLAFTEFQSEVSTAIDIAWETYLYPFLNRGNSYFLYSIAWFTTYSAQQLNTGNLHIRELLINFKNEIGILLESASVESPRLAMMDAYYAYEYHSQRMRDINFEYTQQYTRSPSASGLFLKALNLYHSWRNTGILIGTDILQFTIVSEDKHFCKYQAELDKTCRVMTWALGSTPNCSANARDDWNNLDHVFTDALDLVTLGYFSNWFDDIADVMAEAGASLFKRLIFLIQGLVDGCIPASYVPQYMSNWSKDAVGSLNNLLSTATNGTLDNFADVIFSYLFTDVGLAVDVLETMSNCIDQYAKRTDIGGYTKTINILTCIQVNPKTHDNIGLFAGIALNILNQVGPPLQALDTCFTMNCGGASDFDCFLTRTDCVVDDPATKTNIGMFFAPFANVIHYMYNGVNDFVNVIKGQFRDLQVSFNKLECCLRGVVHCSALNPGCIIQNIACIFLPQPCYNSFQSVDLLGAPSLNQTYETVNGTDYYYDVLYNFNNNSDFVDFIFSTINVTTKYNWTSIFPVFDQALDDIWMSLSNSSTMNITKRFNLRSAEILYNYGLQNGSELRHLLGSPSQQDSDSTAIAVRSRSDSLSRDTVRRSKRMEAMAAHYELMDVYQETATEIALLHKKRGAPLKPLSEMARVWKNPRKILHPAAREVYRLYETSNSTRYRNVIDDLFAVAYRRYGMEYDTRYQKLHLTWKFLKNQVNASDFVSWQRGEKGYLPSQGFIDMERYNQTMREWSTEDSSQQWKRSSSEFSPRSPRKISLFSRSVLSTDPTHLYAAHVGTKHAWRMANESMSKPWGIGQSERANFNEWILSYFDAVINFMMRVFYFLLNLSIAVVKALRSNSSNISFLSRPVVSLKQAALDTVAYFKDYNYKEKALANTTEMLWEKWIDCNVPYNFDGTDMYNPIGCFTLFPEDALSWLKLGPNAYLPLQIPWPEELIVKNCVKTFNGNSDPLNYTASDNCKINDGQFKPFCPWSDYCDRTIGQCKDIGIGDFFDTIMYVLGSMPWFLNNAFELGLPMKETCSYAVAITIIIVFLVGLPDFVATFPLSVITLFFRILGSAFVVYTIFWTANLWWGTVSYSFILAGIFAIALAGYPKELSEFFSSLKFTPYVMMIAGVYLIVYIIWLIFPFPTLHFNPTASLASLVEDIEQSWHFTLYRVDLQWLVARIKRFDYSGGKPPHVDTFCIGWTFGNTAMAVVGPFVVVAGTYISYQFLQTCWIAFLELMQEMSATNLRNRMERMEGRVGNFRGQINALFHRGIAVATNAGNQVRTRVMYPVLRRQPVAFRDE